MKRLELAAAAVQVTFCTKGFPTSEELLKVVAELKIGTFVAPVFAPCERVSKAVGNTDEIAPCVRFKTVEVEFARVEIAASLLPDPPVAAVASVNEKADCEFEVCAELKVMGKFPSANVAGAEVGVTTKLKGTFPDPIALVPVYTAGCPVVPEET